MRTPLFNNCTVVNGEEGTECDNPCSDSMGQVYSVKSKTNVNTSVRYITCSPSTLEVDVENLWCWDSGIGIVIDDQPTAPSLLRRDTGKDQVRRENPSLVNV